LHSQLQQPANVEDALRTVFPFAHFVLTGSGQSAENVFFRAWPKKGIVPQNLLFPSTIFHQIDKGFTPAELPHPAIFQLDLQERHKANMALDALRAQLAQDAAAIACVVVETGNNAAGGQPVSVQHLRDVRALLAPHAIPLVIEATRIVENAQFLIEQDAEYAGRSLWTVVREVLSCADAVIGSLTKDFCVNKGGIIATNDAALQQRLQEVAQEESAGLDLIEKKLIALSLQNRRQIEIRVLRRMEGVRRIWQALYELGVPVVHPVGGHCVLIEVRRIPELRDLEEPVASFNAWLYLNTGIRAAAHSVGMQKNTRINDLVRLAIPVGLKREQIDLIIQRLADAFAHKANIPDLAKEDSAPRPMGNVNARYRLKQYHNVAGAAAKPPAAVHEAVVVDETPAVPVAAGPRPRRVQEVAIVGMAGRYPKARNIRQLWTNLALGRDCIEEIPAERMERRIPYGSNTRYRGGFIDDVDRFDSLFFNISPREAEMLDPQERLFLEVAWEAIEDAGYYPEILGAEDGSRNIGVFVGAVWAMYQIVGVDEQRLGNRVAPNSFLWSVANRVSYWMNLSGPSLTVDTACSSSLTALYLACEAIQAGKCSSAIVGGVNLDLHQAKLDINLIGGALSPDGVCRTFGKGANGYVAGEGVGALYVKPLDRAVQDGDHIYGVIKSAVVNHGGRTSGYFVPNPTAQSSVIQTALQQANVSPQTIGYVEAHGTGTELGDPIEISGLTTAFRGDDLPRQACAIGSIKTNIGHLEAAAGVVSVSKVLLQMRHRKLVPSLHSAEPNPFIDFENSPFYVVQKLEDWNPKEAGGARLPLRAGISSFGAGGANAHVILESYEAPPRLDDASAQPADLVFPLSARNEEQLREMAVRLAQFLREEPVDLRDVAHTLQQGRKSFEHRLAIVARTQDELAGKLTAFADGKRSEDVAVGHVKLAESVTRLLNRTEKQEFIRLLSQSRDPRKIAALWAEGLLADWQGFPSQGKRVPLPTYPFAGKRLWAADPSAVRRVVQTSAGMHPMLDSNESTFERQLFRKVFHDRDFFIYDHLVSDIPTLPGVAYLELARKAGELAAGRPVRRIQNILWVSPIAVQGSIPKEVFV
ncbi:MAG TPA: beta-ketoacyl synthase N-terminal-like domain-containing protein, partial [Thermoanaerobaculia bacterium]|nr:beta-ketoacyl synthase N-terminal-like domain-containing protein [Thermoanaerobaculia bacterium]